MKDYKIKYTAVEIPAPDHHHTDVRYKIVRETTTYIESITDWTIANDLSYDDAAKVIQEFRSLQTLKEVTS